MIKKLKTQIAILTENNLKGYILLSVIFAAGAVLAFAFHGKGAQEEEIKLYFTDFISNVTNSGTDAIKTFNLSMANYIQFAVVMFLSSVTIVGAPAVFIWNRYLLFVQSVWRKGLFHYFVCNSAACYYHRPLLPGLCLSLCEKLLWHVGGQHQFEKELAYPFGIWPFVFVHCEHRRIGAGIYRTAFYKADFITICLMQH